MNTFILNNVRIVTLYNIIENGFVYVKRGIIASIGSSSPARVHRSCPMIDGSGYWLLPGIVDICGRMPEKEDRESFIAMENDFATQGVTSVLHIVPGLTSEPRHCQMRKPVKIRHHYLNNYSAISLFSVANLHDLESRALIPAALIDCLQPYILCSQENTLPLLQTVFLLYHQYGMNLTEAVNMATFNPARAFGLEKKLGSIEWGKIADLVLASESRGIPAVEKVFVSGCLIFDNTRAGPEKNYLAMQRRPPMREGNPIQQ